MTSYILDYSSGWPAPGAVLEGGYVGVLRYAGTPGRGKNLSPPEAAVMLAARVPIGLVYEDTAGWMDSGYAAGQAAARAVLADAKRCGVGVRAVYLACDVDVTSATQMAAVARCCDGAAAVVGLSRTGVYGEADVIDAMLGQRHATWGWQTRAWSGGRVSSRAHLLQQIGYVYPGGVQCDRSTVLATDWGQYPAPSTEMVMDAEVEARFDALETLINHDAGMIIFGDNPNGDPGHAAHLRNVRADVGALATKVGNIQTQLSGLGSSVTAIATRLDQLMTAVAGLALGQGDPDAIRAELAGVLNQTQLIVSTGSAASARGATEGS